MTLCFEENCDGIFVAQVIDYKQELSRGHDSVVITSLQVEKCNKCGELLFDLPACNRIETEIIKKYPDYFLKK